MNRVEIGQNEDNLHAKLIASLDQVHSTCTFQIVSKNQNDVVYLRFNNRTLSGINCQSTTIQIYDVAGLDGPMLLEEICPDSPALKTISSIGNVMEIMVSASEGETAYFDADVFQLPTPCSFFCANDNKCLSIDQRCDGHQDCTDNSDESSCQSIATDDLVDDRAGIFNENLEIVEEEVNTDDRTSNFQTGTDSGCGSARLQQGMQGSFTSLNYPCQYGPRLECAWEITVPFGKSIAIGFNSIFGIEGPVSPTAVESNCPQDKINIFARRDPNDPASEVLVKTFCGVKAPTPFIIKTNHVRVEFTSDDKIDGFGFRLHWAATDPKLPQGILTFLYCF